MRILILILAMVAFNASAMVVFKGASVKKLKHSTNTALCLSVAGKYYAIGKTAVKIANMVNTEICTSSKFRRTAFNLGKKINKVSVRKVGQARYAKLLADFKRDHGAI